MKRAVRTAIVFVAHSISMGMATRRAPAGSGILILALASAVALAVSSSPGQAARFAAAVQDGDVVTVKSLISAASFNANDLIVDRSGARVTPIEASLNALQRYLALVSAKGFGRPGATAVIIGNHLSTMTLLAHHATANLSSSCPLRLAVHYRIFPAITRIMQASADGGLGCILQQDLHGRTLLHVAAASKASGLSSLLNPSHMVHSMPAEHAQSLHLLLSTLKLQPPSPLASDSLISAPTLLRMNALLAAHELQLFIRHSSVTPLHLNGRDRSGRTALHVAATGAYVAAVDALLGAGADANAVDSSLRTALHVACSSRGHTVMLHLLTRGADPNLQDVDGNTALHMAAANADVVAFKLLVQHAADAAIRNNRNQTVCDCSASSHILRLACDGASHGTCAADHASAPPDGGLHPAPLLSQLDSSAADLNAPLSYTPSDFGGWGRAMGERPPVPFSCPFDVIDARSNLSAAQFLSRYVLLQKPVIIKGLGLECEAARSWNREGFIQRWGKLNVTVSAVPHAHSYGQSFSTMTLQAFAQQHMNGSVFTGAYVFDAGVLAAQPGLRSDCPPPPLLQGARIVLSQFFMGDAATGSFPHFHGHALNLLIHGEKLWYLFPPNEAHFNVKSIGRWVSDDFPAIAQRRRAAEDAGLAQCTQHAGDAVYVPQYWGHAVLNTAPSVGVAYEFDV